MPELPDLECYLRALESRILGRRLISVRLGSPFLLRSVDPPLLAVEGKEVTGLQRLGKRLVVGLEGELYLVIHLMIAGRLRWGKPSARLPGRLGQAAFDFRHGTLLLTEAGSKRRASLHVVRGADQLAVHNPGGVEVFEISAGEFADRLKKAPHTLKRALTDPRIFSGIGNAYSDEILHAARLSPFRRTAQLKDAEISRLYECCRRTLHLWVDRLKQEMGEEFPKKVTAFRPGMAVHGRYKKPCPECGSPVQRIVWSENECNYCATCQTGGKVLADRALSRLLREDWPRSLEELESLLPRRFKPKSTRG